MKHLLPDSLLFQSRSCICISLVDPTTQCLLQSFCNGGNQSYFAIGKHCIHSCNHKTGCIYWQQQSLYIYIDGIIIYLVDIQNQWNNNLLARISSYYYNNVQSDTRRTKEIYLLQMLLDQAFRIYIVQMTIYISDIWNQKP